MKVIGKYKNGNYKVMIMADGTKIRFNNEDCLIPNMPESMDLKITNCCNMGCPMCHEGSIKNGKHGDLLNVEFFNTMHPYTEIAIGGGNPLEHPDLVSFLHKMKELKMIPSMTVHQNHFMENLDLLHYLVDNELIYGLGVSFVHADNNLITELSKFPNAVLHVINGLVSMDNLKKLAHHNFKMLILGYKEFRRGKDLYEKDSIHIHDAKNQFYYNLDEIISNNWFKVVSFDNLAIKQLNPHRLMSDRDWNEFYMGDDGHYTMFIDLVEKTFSTSSTTPPEHRHKLMNNLNDMFHIVQEENHAM